MFSCSVHVKVPKLFVSHLNFVGAQIPNSRAVHLSDSAEVNKDSSSHFFNNYYRHLGTL